MVLAKPQIIIKHNVCMYDCVRHFAKTLKTNKTFHYHDYFFMCIKGLSICELGEFMNEKKLIYGHTHYTSRYAFNNF